MNDIVEQLRRLGPLPTSKDADPHVLAEFERLLNQLQPPITDEDARLLVTLFGPDECFGLAWTLIHLIESAPNWPLADSLEDTQNKWVALLLSRSDRAIGRP